MNPPRFPLVDLAELVLEGARSRRRTYDPILLPARALELAEVGLAAVDELTRMSSQPVLLAAGAGASADEPEEAVELEEGAAGERDVEPKAADVYRMAHVLSALFGRSALLAPAPATTRPLAPEEGAGVAAGKLEEGAGEIVVEGGAGEPQRDAGGELEQGVGVAAGKLEEGAGEIVVEGGAGEPQRDAGGELEQGVGVAAGKLEEGAGEIVVEGGAGEPQRDAGGELEQGVGAAAGELEGARR